MTFDFEIVKYIYVYVLAFILNIEEEVISGLLSQKNKNIQILHT